MTIESPFDIAKVAMEGQTKQTLASPLQSDSALRDRVSLIVRMNRGVRRPSFSEVKGLKPALCPSEAAKSRRGRLSMSEVGVPCLGFPRRVAACARAAAGRQALSFADDEEE
jgi:hypothetical protein